MIYYLNKLEFGEFKEPQRGLIVENVVLQEFMNIYYRHLVYYHQNQNQY